MADVVRPLSLCCCVLGVAIVLAATGCGENAGADGDAADAHGRARVVLSKEEAMQALRQLPYRYRFRAVATPEGADAAVAGRVTGSHQTVLNFGIALGHGHHGVPVPRAGTSESYGYPLGGFIFTTDTFVEGPDGQLERGPQFKTAAQWHEASRIEVMMTDKLCLAATGRHCPP